MRMRAQNSSAVMKSSGLGSSDMVLPLLFVLAQALSSDPFGDAGREVAFRVVVVAGPGVLPVVHDDHGCGIEFEAFEHFERPERAAFFADSAERRGVVL